MQKIKRFSLSFKHHPTNHSQSNHDQHVDEFLIDDEVDFQQIHYNRQRKNRFMNDKDDRVQARTIRNSNISDNRNLWATTIKHNNGNDNPFQISKYALDYAAEYHDQPIKKECHPKLKDPRERSKFIQSVLNYIRDDSLNQNVSHSKLLLFDLCWIDTDGNIQAISKSTETVVYLFQASHYPKELNNIKIISYPS